MPQPRALSIHWNSEPVDGTQLSFAVGQQPLSRAKGPQVYEQVVVAQYLTYKAYEFAVEGTLVRFAFRDGQYVDTYVMARLRT